MEAGASGACEVGEGDAVIWILYAPLQCAAAVRAAAERGLSGEGILGEWEDEPDIDWPETWKEGLGPIQISPRLTIRPPFAPAGSHPEREVVIEPGQAFGTGAHRSTWLALAGIDRLARIAAPPRRVLDVGTGSGVLALAALRLWPGARALACDLDPLAAPAARENAARNGLGERLHLFTGGVEALAPEARFDCLLANLLRRELEPLLPQLAERAAPGARCVFSGLLESETGAVARRLRGLRIRVLESPVAADADGERWAALLARREG